MKKYHFKSDFLPQMILFNRILNLLISRFFAGKFSNYAKKQIFYSIKNYHLASEIFTKNDTFSSFEKSAYKQNLKMSKFSSQISVGYSKPKHGSQNFENQFHSIVIWREF